MDASIEERMKDFVRSEIKNKPRPYAQKYGYDWCDLSEEEEFIFGLELRDLPLLVNVWGAFCVMTDVADIIDLPKDIVEQFRRENPWITIGDVNENEWEKFSKIFNVKRRKAVAWFWKMYFYELRNYGKE